MHVWPCASLCFEKKLDEVSKLLEKDHSEGVVARHEAIEVVPASGWVFMNLMLQKFFPVWGSKTHYSQSRIFPVVGECDWNLQNYL